jgi:hypothetical protein
MMNIEHWVENLLEALSSFTDFSLTKPQGLGLLYLIHIGGKRSVPNTFQSGTQTNPWDMLRTCLSRVGDIFGTLRTCLGILISCSECFQEILGTSVGISQDPFLRYFATYLALPNDFL